MSAIHADMYKKTVKMPVRSNGRDYLYNVLLPDFLLFTAIVSLKFSLALAFF